MKKLIILLLILLLAVWLVLKVQAYPGYALFVYQDWTIEMPLWFVALAVVVAFIVFYVLVRILKWIGRLGIGIRSGSELRHLRRSHKLMNRGLLQLSEGHYVAAEHSFTKGASLVDKPFGYYLLAAKAACKQNVDLRGEEYLHLAQQSIKGSEFAVGLSQAKLYIGQGLYEQAVAILRHLRALNPNHHLLLKLMYQVSLKQQDWYSILELLPVMRRHKVLTTEEMLSSELNCHRVLLALAKEKSYEDLRAYWMGLAKNLRKSPRLAYTYASYLLDMQQVEEAERVILESVHQQWDESLITLYGLLDLPEGAGQIQFAEAWLKEHPNNPTLLLCLGRICTRRKLWAKARSYLDQSLKLKATAEVYYALGVLAEHNNDMTKAREYFRQGLQVGD